ncbi:hypothetical protein A9320_17805 [Ruegeria sp. PBVC088]|nr:hypothetical protein A9320_17805 [Ruegeria sp. PBVC088]
MTQRKDGLDGAGAAPGDKVKCLGQRDEGGVPIFIKGQVYTVGTAPLGDACVWVAPPKQMEAPATRPFPLAATAFSLR